MKKIFLMFVFIMLLCGCQDKDIDNNKISNEESTLKYKEMEDKLVEYGKLVYENEQWLNDDAVEITTAMTLKDLSERNGYDISIFVDLKTNKQCDLDASRIEFMITDTSNLEDIKYVFNPVLVCNDDDRVVTSEDLKDAKYNELYDKLISYTEEFYDVKNIKNKNLSVGEYKLTLKDLKNANYDISMFVNPDTKKSCDLESSYSLLNVVNVDDKKDYKFNYYLNCE